MKKGFTLLELIIVIIVIGVLATLATGQYIKVVEKARAGEGAYLLGILRSAQMRYYAESKTYVYATAVTNLDVTFTTPKYFATPAVYNDATKLADIARSGGPTYTLAISEGGTISCTVAGSAGCTQAGY